MSGGDSLRLIVARSSEEIEAAERLQYRVYSEEERLIEPRARLEESEAEEDSTAGRSARFLVLAGHDPVGTVRLTLPRGDGGLFGFELEWSFELGGFASPGVVPAEVTRFCVLRRYRGTRAAGMLYRGLVAESLRRGVTHLVAAANMETDCAADAELAHRLIEARRLVDRRFCARPRRATLPPPPTRFVYSPAERERFRQGDDAALGLPRTLALFAERMGARYVGPPAYEPHFHVFALPLVAELTGIRTYHSSGIRAALGPG